MNEKPSTKQAIVIDAPIERVWEALTIPDQIVRWFFGVETLTDWTVGSPIVHRGEYQGRPYEDRGVILEFEPPKRLVHTHWSPVSALPDAPENYDRVSWELSEAAGGTKLTIRESNLASEEAKATSERSWRLALEGLKEFIEGKVEGGKAGAEA